MTKGISWEDMKGDTSFVHPTDFDKDRWSVIYTSPEKVAGLEMLGEVGLSRSVMRQRTEGDDEDVQVPRDPEFEAAFLEFQYRIGLAAVDTPES